MIKQLNFRGETLINVPADMHILLEMGLSKAEAEQALGAYQAEKELEKIRAYRAPLLIEADHLVNIALDKGLDIKPARDYRQALRDITDKAQVFADVEWPTKPTDVQPGRITNLLVKVGAVKPAQ
ncbi:phage tail assembly chaperone [Vibrio sp. Of14-4]|uniref:phage tail assembly chaperone n=1 Tax=Vibrio sp. Of14-4 TaxID=2724878 RepID=UPI001EF3C89A|nr:phage tail assembly chaperone [Vibrio sp. Of14-4]MCG7491525.1 phage tail assembly chaperone [Vibrio sp. Of14-4]